MTGHRNGYATVWKCERGAKAAITYLRKSKHYNGGTTEEYLMAASDCRQVETAVRRQDRRILSGTARRRIIERTRC